jgi:SpoU rRNA methylase family enzyme
MLVLENNDGTLEGINELTEDFDLDLSEDSNYDGVFAFDTMGNEMDVEDIEEGNLVYASKLDYDGDDYVLVVVVQDNMVEGELSKVKRDRVTLDGDTYKAIKSDGDNFQAFYSLEGFEDIRDWDVEEDYYSDMDDADGETMYAYLDATGRIAFLSTEAKATSAFKYGVVTRTYADGDRVKVFTQTEDNEGDEITYDVEEEENLVTPILLDKNGNPSENSSKELQYAYFDANDRLNIGAKDNTEYEAASGEELNLMNHIVKFKLNNDGEIAEDEFYVVDPSNVQDMDGDFGVSSIKGDNSYSVDDRAVIIDAKSLYNDSGEGKVNDSGEYDVVKWEDLSDESASGLKFFAFTKRNNDLDIEALVFVGDKGADSSSDEEAIYVIDTWMKGGDRYVEYISYEDKEVQEREVDKGYDGDERPYVAEIKSDGKIELIATNAGTDDFEFESGVIKTKSNNVITLEGKDGEFKLQSSAIVYEEDSKKSTSNIRKGDSVWFVLENGVNIRVIERLVGSEAIDPDLTDEEEAKAVDTLIEAIPGTINESNLAAAKTATEAARTAYDELTTAQKALVKSANVTALTDAEDAIEALEGPLTYIIDAYSAGFGRVTLENVDGDKTNFVVANDFDNVFFNEEEVTKAQMNDWLSEASRVGQFVEVEGKKLVVLNDDAEALYAAIALADTKVESEYTATTWSGLTTALALPEATATNMTDKTDAITTAISNLVEMIDSTIVFADGETVTKDNTDLPYTNTVSGDGTGAITYSGNNDDLATVNASTGEVTFVAGTGNVTITATKAATATHNAVTATYVLTIN